jgi:hypothetical protein
LLSEFADAPLRETFYRAHRLNGVRIADPFMGGGTPLLEANRLGCEIFGFDINPMSWWIVREQLDHIDLKSEASTDPTKPTLATVSAVFSRWRTLALLTRCYSTNAFSDAPLRATATR